MTTISARQATSIRILGGNRNAFRPPKFGWNLTDRLATASSLAELEALDDLKFDVKKLRQQADYQVETRAKKLGMRLSELRTNLLPIPDLVGEEGVPMKLSGLAKVA